MLCHEYIEGFPRSQSLALGSRDARWPNQRLEAVSEGLGLVADGSDGSELQAPKMGKPGAMESQSQTWFWFAGDEPLLAPTPPGAPVCRKSETGAQSSESLREHKGELGGQSRATPRAGRLGCLETPSKDPGTEEQYQCSRTKEAPSSHVADSTVHSSMQLSIVPRIRHVE